MFLGKVVALSKYKQFSLEIRVYLGIILRNEPLENAKRNGLCL